MRGLIVCEPIEADYPTLPPPGVIERVRTFCQVRQLARRWEAWRPLTLGFLAAVVVACAGLRHTSVTAIVVDVLPVALTMTVILAGFAVAQSLLLLSVERPVIARLRASGHYDALVGYFCEATRSAVCFVTVAISILFLHACGMRVPAHDRLVPSALAGCFVWACLSARRITRLMLKLALCSDGTPPAT
jgi:hypothetical protein